MEGLLPAARCADGHRSQQQRCGEPTRNTKHVQGCLTTIRHSCFSQCCRMLLCGHLWQCFMECCCSQISAIATRPNFALMIIAFLLLCNRSSIHHIHFLSHSLQFHHLAALYRSYMQCAAPTALKYAGVCPALDISQPC